MTVLSKSLEFILAQLKSGITDTPLIVGICGPQGSGKTYVSEALAKELNVFGYNCVKLSMDDFYVTHSEQLIITKQALKDDNKLVQGRGLPGTHDISFCLDIFNKLKHWTGPVNLPIYDKSAYGGKGDRSSESYKVDKKPDVVIFEGWFNGYQSLGVDLLRLRYFSAPEGSYLPHHRLYHLEENDTNLAKYSQIWQLFDSFICIEADYKNVYIWREQQEHDLISKTGHGMSDDEIVRFISRYMPMYELYYGDLIEKGYQEMGNKTLKLRIDLNRNIEE